MKTSATETEFIDRYLNGALSEGDHLLFDAQLVLNADLKDKANWQQKTQDIIQLRGRMQLKEQIKQAETIWFSQPEYNTLRQRIFKLFGL